MKWLIRLRDSMLVRPRKVARSETIRRHSLDPSRIRSAARVKRLASLGPANTMQLVADDVLNDASLVALLRTAAEKGTLLWIVSVKNQRELLQLEKTFDGLLLQLSINEPTCPTLFGMRPQEVLRESLRTNPGAAKEFAGINTAKLHSDTVSALREVNSEVVHTSVWTRMAKHPQLPVYLLVLVYSSLRALPVAFVKEFHGSIMLFWTIDIVTAIPYTWGVLTMIFGKSTKMRVLGGITTIITFVAPYAYFLSHGKHYPPHVPIVIVILTLLTVTTEVFKYIQERNLEKHYKVALPIIR